MKTRQSNLTANLVAAMLACMLLLLAAGCEKDESPASQAPPPGPPNTGSANFTRYVALGNSITAGFQSNALSERDQRYSYPSLIAAQVQTSFEQPLMRNPGIGSRIRLVNLTPPTLVEETGANPFDPATNLKSSLPAPYNNLGIPGASLYDILDTTGASTNFLSKSIARANPFFSQILRTQALGRSVFEQAKTLHPTFITIWIGNNDVLGYAISGGTRGSNVLPPSPGTLPTEGSVFDAWFRAALDSLRTTGAGIVTANLPDIPAIPFFTTLGAQIHPSLPPAGGGSLVPLRYQAHGNSGVALDTTTLSGAATDPFILLSGAAYAPLLGQPTGKYYRDNGISSLPPGIDTTKPFGFHPQNPWPDALTLDQGEAAVAREALANFNASIDSIAANRGIGVVDVHGIFNRILQNGQAGFYIPDLGSFTTAFIAGGLFSYDGIHPSSRGQAIVANAWIDVINAKFNGQIPHVSVSSVAGMPMGKASAAGSRVPEYSGVDWSDLIRLMNRGSDR